VRWNKPEYGWHKLNREVCPMGNLGLASRGAIIWDHSGLWIRSFTHFIGVAASVDAKF